MNLGQVMSFAAERYPDREAIVDGARRFTYRAWNARVERLARSLQELGVARGERVVTLLKNREEHAAVYWACQRIGAVVTPLNWRYASGDVEYCVNDAEAVAVIFEEASRSALLAAREKFRTCRLFVFVGGEPPAGCLAFDALAGEVGEVKPPAVAESDLSIILYTSGTTGRPKGVPRTHKAERAAATAHIIQSGNAGGDRTLGVMPLYHTMGVRSMIAMAILNGCLVMMPDWDPVLALRLIQDERINSLYLVPTLYHDLLAQPDLSRYDLVHLKKLGYAGAPMSATLTRRLVETFRPEVFVNHLGSTEVYTFTVCDRAAQKPTCAGRPGVHGRVRVVRADPDRAGSPDALVPRGEVGELIVSLESDEAFSGYWRRPDADAKAIRCGWYFTGDLAYEDEDGDIYTVGRVDDMIISGGENIHPMEVEEVLLRHPGVAEACVIGLPDERWGQVVTAFVVQAAGGVTATELDEFCRSNPDLANFKRPRRYEFVRALPKSPTGKLLRRKLRDGDYEPLPGGRGP